MATTPHAAALAVMLLFPSVPPTVAAQTPNGEWRQYSTAHDAGFSAERLETARRFADSAGAAAVMVVHRGALAVAWGAVDRPFQAHSMRKSLLSALYGIRVAQGRIDLDASLDALGIDDLQGLTDLEKRATVRDLLTARSGVYHSSAYAPESQEQRLPPRGSHAPGTFWCYNNWDFNALGTIYERTTGQDIFEDFFHLIAEPLGMQDYDPELNFDVLEPSKSQHEAYTFRISARDLARFGFLYLKHGLWHGQQLVPAQWVDESTQSYSDADPGGYGYMWWVYPAGTFGPRDVYDRYAARGSGGQVMYVIPEIEMIVVIRGDTDNGRGISTQAVGGLLERLLSARISTPAAGARLERVTPLELSNLGPAPTMPRSTPIDPAAYAAYLGEYAMAPGQNARVFLHEGRPFLFVPGRGEAELFPTSATSFFVRVESGVTVEFDVDASGRATGLVLSQRNTRTVAPKVGS